MWEIDNLAQISAFLYSLCLGAIFCVFYDVFRSFRLAIKFSDVVIFFQDIFYFLIISFVTFIFLLSITNGEIRGYVIFGILFGFLVCNLTLSKILLKFLSKILKYLVLAFKKGNTVLNSGFSKADTFISKIFKNIANTFKKGLKKVKGLLYTKK